MIDLEKDSKREAIRLALKQLADVVTVAARGEGVVELIDGLLAGTLPARTR